MKISEQGENIIISDFDEVQALKIAMRLEEQGRKFYLEAEKLAKTQEAKEIFNELSSEEKKHFEEFSMMFQLMIKTKKLDTEKVDRGDEEDMFDFVDSGVFRDALNVGKIIKSIKTDVGAIEFGEKTEIGSIKFYQAMLNNSSSNQTKEIIKEIIREEQKHLKTLVEYKELLGK